MSPLHLHCNAVGTHGRVRRNEIRNAVREVEARLESVAQLGDADDSFEQNYRLEPALTRGQNDHV